MLGDGAIGELPISTAATEENDAAFAAACLGSVADVVYLVEIDAYHAVNGLTTLTYSDRGWTSAPDDDVVNVHYEGRAVVPLVVDRAMPIAPEQSRRLAVEFGTIELLLQ